MNPTAYLGIPFNHDHTLMLLPKGLPFQRVNNLKQFFEDDLNTTEHLQDVSKREIHIMTNKAKHLQQLCDAIM